MADPPPHRLGSHHTPHWYDAHLDSPWDLRAFFDLKSLWNTREVARYLKVSPALAGEILLTTSYTRREGSQEWVLGASAMALARKQLFDERSQTSYY